MGRQQDRGAEGGTVGRAHSDEHDGTWLLRKPAKVLQLRAKFRIAAIGANQIEESLRLLTALYFKDLGASGVEQVRRRLDPVDPARCFHIRVSHDTVLKIMRVRK